MTSGVHLSAFAAREHAREAKPLRLHQNGMLVVGPCEESQAFEIHIPEIAESILWRSLSENVSAPDGRGRRALRAPYSSCQQPPPSGELEQKSRRVAIRQQTRAKRQCPGDADTNRDLRTL